jgi:aminomethyltransferase
VLLRTLIRDFGDIDAEASACREGAALFDFSFMSRGISTGAGAREAVQSLTDRPLADLRPGRIRYGVRTDSRGYALADLTVWQMTGTHWEVFSGRREDIAAIPEGLDASAETCILSLQGPGSLRALELVAPAAAKQHLWNALAARARPAGFAAADILRIEAGFVFFANEFKLMVTPAEAGLQRFGDASRAVPKVELVGFTADSAERPVLFAPAGTGRFPPEPGEIVVTSAAWSVRSGCIIGLGYVRAGEHRTSLVDAAGVFQDIRRGRVPFVDPLKRRVRGGWRPDDLLPGP